MTGLSILSDREFHWFQSLSKDKQHRMFTAVHESGHCIATLAYNGFFNFVTVDTPPGCGYLGVMNTLGLLDGHTGRQFVSVHLGGWAAVEAFYGYPFDFFQDGGCASDLNQILEYLNHRPGSEKIISETQPMTKQIMIDRIADLKSLAFRLFHAGSMTCAEAKGHLSVC